MLCIMWQQTCADSCLGWVLRWRSVAFQSWPWKIVFLIEIKSCSTTSVGSAYQQIRERRLFMLCTRDPSSVNSTNRGKIKCLLCVHVCYLVFSVSVYVLKVFECLDSVDVFPALLRHSFWTRLNQILHKSHSLKNMEVRKSDAVNVNKMTLFFFFYRNYGSSSLHEGLTLYTCLQFFPWSLSLFHTMLMISEKATTL